MLNKILKKSAAPTPRPKSKSKSKSKSNPKIKPKVIQLNKPITKPLSAKSKQTPIKIKSKDLNSTLALKRQTPVRSKSRPKTSLSNTFKKPPPKPMKYKINMNDLVTQQDMIVISEQSQMDTLPTLNKMMERTKSKKRFSEEQASALIQKTWRGYKTRKIVKHYLNLYKKIDYEKAFSKNKGGSGTKKKQREGDSRRIEYQEERNGNDNTIKSRYEININMNINISPVKQYNFNKNKEEHMKSQLSSKSVSIKSFNQRSFVSENIAESQLFDPMLRITQLQLNLILAEEQKKLQRLKDKLDSRKIDSNIYEIKRQIIVKHYDEERKKLVMSKSQLVFGFAKVPFGSGRPQSSNKTKSKNHCSEEKFVRRFNTLNSLESQEDDGLSLDYNFSYIQNESPLLLKKQQQQLLIRSQKTPHLQKPRKTFISAFLQDDLEQINTQDIQNLSQGSLQIVREHIDFIQQAMQNRLIDQLVIELYLNPSVNKQLTSFFDLTHISQFQKITNQDVSEFIDIMFTKFKPNNSDLLKRLNQKINPTAEELLKILRNQDGDGTDQFYELVIPQKNFKEFREWREKEIQMKNITKNKKIKNKVSIDDLEQHQRIKFEQKEKQYFDKKIKLGRFQKDLQAMYLKSVFNCLNQAIVQTKCSYSPINGRSTIGPGQLRVSLLDSNSQISSYQIPKILVKSKTNVMRNFKFACPSLNVADYDSVYRFQQALMKQLHEQISQSQHRWMSFFDQHLEIAMEIYNVVLQQLMVQAVREMYWKVWKR